MIAALAGTVFGWIDTGHMIVAAVAERDLTARAREESARLLQIGGDEKTRDFLGASCWADDVKNAENGPWHYINHHFSADGKMTLNKPAEQNAVWAIRKFSDTLADRSKPDAERADALRFLLHFVGDVHQPLHTTARDTPDHPTGDRGGNDFTFEPFDLAGFKIRNLHFLWDIAGGLYGATERPLKGRAAIDTLAEAVLKLNPRSSFPEVAESSPMAWSFEGEILSRGVVYGLEQGKRPSDSYLAMCKHVSERRLALAGYRLADLLNRLL